MTNYKNAALYTFCVVVLSSIFSISIFAQKAESMKTEPSKQCSGEKFVMPASVAIDKEVLTDFIEVASLPATDRKIAFRALSNEQKSYFIKVNLALQLVKRTAMTKEQQEFVLDAISKISVDLYDKSDPEKIRISEQIGLEMVNKALGLFPHKELGDFIEPLMTDKSAEVLFAQKYEDLLKNGSKSRMRIVKNFPVNDRVNIWKTQLAYQLAAGNFSKVQNDFILEMLTSLSAETFTSRENLTEEERSKAEGVLINKIINVFSKNETFAVFMTLGIQKYIKDEQITTNDLLRTCDCNWSCPGSGWCTGNGCTSSPIGDCGPFGLTRCHSLCE